MKLFWILSVVIATCVRCGSADFEFLMRLTRQSSKMGLEASKVEEPPLELYFNQIVDHYNSSDERSWLQRYFVHKKYYVKGGPIFLVLSGEEDMSPDILTHGFIRSLTKKFEAISFALEHRYYEKYRYQCFKNLTYLNSEQALMDAAYFIMRIRSFHNLDPESKVIVFGASYSGSLAAWMRVKYPHLVHGVVSQSAPLLARVDYPEYYSVIDNALRGQSQLCYDAVATSLKEFYITLRDEAGRKKLEKLFLFCESFESKNISENVLAEIYGWLLYLVEYSASNKFITLSNACDILTDNSVESPLERLAVINQLVLKKGNDSCFPPNHLTEAASWVQPWIYQLCTEFGWYQTTGLKPFNLFSQTIATSSHLHGCVKTIGSSFLQTLELGVERTNLIYGGLNIVNTSSNIVFIHGSNDPWSSAGIQNSTNPKVSVIVIEGAGHVPMYNPPIEDQDNQIRRAILEIEKLIVIWANLK